MRIVLLCATRRGLLFLEHLHRLAPDADLEVFSFREEPIEPPFLDSIKGLAQSIGRFHEARYLGSAEWEPFWESEAIDLMFAVSWRYMIPPRVYRKPRLGTYVFHDSLLPKYRGFSPTVWATINGEEKTGVSLIAETDYVGTIMENVTGTYLELLGRNLTALLAGTAERRPQDQALATYTCRRLPEDNRIQWERPVREIYNLVRAVSRPYSGAYTLLDGQKLTIWTAEPVLPGPHYVGRVPGRVVEIRRDVGAVVLAGDGCLLVKDVQLEGAQPCCASSLLKSLGQTLGR
jgi:methionyl-tRNA formyltransferase